MELMGYKQKGPTLITQDNNDCIFLVKGSASRVCMLGPSTLTNVFTVFESLLQDLSLKSGDTRSLESISQQISSPRACQLGVSFERYH